MVRGSGSRVLLSHLVSAAIMVVLMRWTGESPRIFIYGFFINYFYRLLTLHALVALDASRRSNARRLARALSRPPAPNRPTYPVIVKDARGARPGNLSAYLIVLLACGGFTFVEINVADGSIATPGAAVREELVAGLAAGGAWWLLDLLDRRLTIRFGEPAWVNFGYNSSETSLLALTMLTGGIVSALRETPWPYFLALLAFKTWFDVWEETKYPRGEHPAQDRSSARST